jgi:hypothetical protein
MYGDQGVGFSAGLKAVKMRRLRRVMSSVCIMSVVSVHHVASVQCQSVHGHVITQFEQCD